MKVGYISFDFGKTGGPNVTSNPFLNQSRTKINALIEDPVERVKARVDDIKTYMGVIHKALVQVKFFQPKERKVIKEEGQNEELCSHYCKYMPTY